MVILGFDDRHGGQRRIIIHDLVGGRGVHLEPFNQNTGGTSKSSTELQKWSWGDEPLVRCKLVTTNVMMSAPSYVAGVEQERDFPPDGGVGLRAVAKFSWYPEAGADDELMFPKGAVVAECRNVNDDWFHGTYMGSRGIFPSNYVVVLERSPALR